MDLDLPDGNGLAGIEDLRRDPMTENIPVIAFSGMDAEANRPHALAAGCSDYFSKPFKIYDLTLRLQCWLSS